jgi:hypothetical protein
LTLCLRVVGVFGEVFDILFGVLKGYSIVSTVIISSGPSSIVIRRERRGVVSWEKGFGAILL